MAHFWLVLTVLVVILLFWKWRRPRNFPPGPWALPILGNFLQVDFTNPLPKLRKLAKRYGNVFSIYLGNNPAVVLHGFQAVKEALVNYGAEFSDRPEDPMFMAILNNKGIVSAPYGQHWKEQRRFSLTLLRNFGLGRTSMETRILEQTKYLVKYFKENEGHSFDPRGIILNTIGNVMCSILFGRRFDYSEKTLETIFKLINEMTEHIGSFWGELYNAIPFIRGLPLPFQKVFKNNEVVQGFLHDIIEEHKRTMTLGEPRDFIDYYLEEIHKRQNDGSSFDEKNLHSLMFDLLEAGSNTQASSILWALLFMMAYPEVQVKCYREIESTLNGKEEFSYKDRASMPYTQAVLHEVQRFASIVPLNVPHCFTKEVSFLGYTIPRHTRVIVDLSSALWDESQWKFPHEFNPSNFLNDDGEFIKPEAFLLFSAGPRVCLGENLAQMESFLIFTTLLKQFEFFWPEKSTTPDLTPVFAIVHFPPPYKVGVKYRHD